MKILIRSVALILGLSGMFALLAPGMTGESSGLNPSLAGLTEIRATFGGFHLGFVIFLVWCSLSVNRYRYALASISLMMGGAALGHLSGIAIDRSPEILSYVALGVEIPSTLIAVWLLSKDDGNSSTI